jgi:molybdopterin synthase catalytic subunit
MSPDRILTRVTDEPLRDAELVGFVTVPEAGGVVTFSGVVRNHHRGRTVLRIDYEAVEALASRKLRELAEEVLSSTEVHRVAAIHRTGTVEIGEASVIVAASASHREEAFRAARTLIDRIKEVLPVWKHEHFADGEKRWAPGCAVPAADRSPGPTLEAGREC